MTRRYFIIVNLLIYLFDGTLCTVDEDFVDTETEIDEEADLKCDACKIIAKKFGDSFASAQLAANRHKLNEDEIVEATDAACNDLWEGYGIKVVDDTMRLDGPDALEDVKKAPGTSEPDNALWVRRFEDMCDELLSESQDEMTLYNLWMEDISALETYLCKGDGSLGACSSKDWGPWPGDDYLDYEEDDMEYIHDEF